MKVQGSDDKYSANAVETTDDDGQDLPIYFYYEGLNPGDNMFTADAIASMATFETALLEHDGW